MDIIAKIIILYNNEKKKAILVKCFLSNESTNLNNDILYEFFFVFDFVCKMYWLFVR